MPVRTGRRTEQPNTTLARVLCLLSFCFGMLAVSSGCRNPYAVPGYPGAPGMPPNGGYNPGGFAGGAAPTQPFAPGVEPNGAGFATGPQSVFAQSQTSPQLLELQRRVQQLDDNNRQLTTQIAQAQQQSEAFRQRADLLAKQLQDAATQNKQLLAATQMATNQARSMQASIAARGGAKLTANNSVAQSPGGLQIPGAQVFAEGDLVRIRLSADQLFATSSIQFTPTAVQQLDQVATSILQRYPRQRIAIEGHSDNAPVNSGTGYTTPYQLAGAQAQAVMDALVRRNGVPTQQLFVIAHGPNHPIADNASPAGRAENRRIDIVVYPDTF